MLNMYIFSHRPPTRGEMGDGLEYRSCSLPSSSPICCVRIGIVIRMNTSAY